jgi:creatinine amidohydrolase/Fe(II)-dependent formamide hydrolase-like protein
MTTYFDYSELTWDAVAGLPRNTPLVLPLGSAYDMNLLADQLDHPPQLGLLPTFPFGWRGSGLEIPEPILFKYLTNLLDSLRDDGFSNVYCLIPQGLNLQSFYTSHSTSFITQHHEASQHSIQNLISDSERSKVVLIPIGHTEQHGYHLPLSVDTV